MTRPGSPSTDVIAGKNPVLEALRAGRRVNRICLSAGLKQDKTVAEITRLAEDAGVQIDSLPSRQFDRLAPGATHQGVVAFAERKEYVSVDDLLERARARGEDPFVILLDGVEDPHNLGAILRVADGAGAHGVVIPRHHAVGFTTTVLKASAGAAEHVPIAQTGNIMDAVTRLKRSDVWVGVAEAEEGKPYYAERLTGPLGLVLGGEGRGVSRPILKHADFRVQIPLAGHVSSLNVSVATAVLAFERARQVALQRQGAVSG